MNSPTRAIAMCRTCSACLIAAKCCSRHGASAHSKMHAVRVTIFSAIKIIGNVTMVISPPCSIRRSGPRSNSVSRNPAMRAPAIRSSDRKSAHARAVELVSGTKLKDVAVRKDLYGKGAAALQAAHDPMLDLARMIDDPAREARKAHEAQDETKAQAYSEIANARFALEGTSNYPDATFTLRLSYGTVRGYEQDGKQIAPFTDFA